MRVKTLVATLVFIVMTGQSLFGWLDRFEGSGWRNYRVIIIVPNPLLPIPMPAYLGYPFYRLGRTEPRGYSELPQVVFERDRYSRKTSLRRALR